MIAGTIQLKGKRLVIVAEKEFDRLHQRAAVAVDVDLPALPGKLAGGIIPPCRRCASAWPAS